MPKPPGKSRLAVNVPARGMHGYLPELSGELDYWEYRKQTAFDYGDTAIYDVANELSKDIGETVKYARLWMRYGAVDTGLDRSNARAWQGWDRSRRDKLGVIAMSRLCREIFLEGMLWDDYRARGEGDEERIGIFPEVSVRDADHDVLDIRIHMLGRTMDVFLDDSFDPETEGQEIPGTEGRRAIWYKARGVNNSELYLRREAPVNLTPSYEKEAEKYHAALDLENMQTLFPYLPSIR